MRFSVIIPTFNRKELLPLVLALLEEQTRPISEVIISAPDQGHVADYSPRTFKVSSVFGTAGLCAQRNRALGVAIRRSDIVTFFDDDFLPARNYFEILAAAFQSNINWAVIGGTVVADGA